MYRYIYKMLHMMNINPLSKAELRNVLDVISTAPYLLKHPLSESYYLTLSGLPVVGNKLNEISDSVQLQ